MSEHVMFTKKCIFIAVIYLINPEAHYSYEQ